ncbi:MAG: hypothetical protein P4L22_06425 [Candidatus Babeliales bacterium]|nr:hypothetical protein [Candidatus Babeliales bacterium]
MNKLYLFILIFFFINLHSSENPQVIPKASYFVYDGVNLDYENSDLSKGHVNLLRNINFYTFDGNLITKIEHNFRIVSMQMKLDPDAKIPRPLFFRVKENPTICIPFGLKKTLQGIYVLFYDKHRNLINYFEYTGSKNVTRETLLFQKTSYRKDNQQYYCIGEILDLLRVEEYIDEESNITQDECPNPDENEDEEGCGCIIQ